MLKKPMLLNVMLLVVSGVLFYNVSQMWLSFFQPGEVNELAKEPEAARASLDKEKKGKVKFASLSSYNIIGEQTVFRPQRQEWTPPPPQPPPPAKPAPAPKKEPDPPPLPDPAVMGIILEEDGERIAIMQGHRREEVKVRSRRRGRPQKRIVADRVRTYHEGDTISEAIILEIQEDRVIIEKEGQRTELALGNKGSEPTARSSARPPTRKTRSTRSPYRRPKVSSPSIQEPSDLEQPPLSPPAGIPRSEQLKRIRKAWRRGLPHRLLDPALEEDID